MADRDAAIRRNGHIQRLANKDRLPIQVKPYIPEDVEQILDELYREDHAYPREISCWKCDRCLPLEDIQFEWPIGQYGFYFGRVPGYRCPGCKETYFPREVLDTLSAAVERELARLDPPPFRNPDRLRPVG